MHAGNMGRQAALAFSNVARALERLGSSTANVVRVQMYVTDIAKFDEVAALHKQFFGQEPPAATVVEVSALAHPDLMFEVEVTALAPS
jgi:enamine deaminase RidA (YjgF/YER057c/UK114 family)